MFSHFLLPEFLLQTGSTADAITKRTSADTSEISGTERFTLRCYTRTGAAHGLLSPAIVVVVVVGSLHFVSARVRRLNST